MGLCVKCKAVEGSIDIRFAVYCGPCFQEATYHKYRTAVSKCWPERTRPAALVFLETHQAQLTLASRCLLHFTQLPHTEDPQRKGITCWTAVIPVKSLSEVESIAELKNTLLQLYPDLKGIYFLPLAAVFSESLPLCTGATDMLSLPWDRLVTLQSTGSSTAQQDLATILWRRLLLRLLKIVNLQKVFLPISSTANAIEAISSVSKGRGQAACFQSAFVMSYPDDMQLLKPLRDISDREINFYTDLAFSSGPVPTPKAVMPTSIDDLTTRFINGLENDFPGTSSTVLRTVDKIPIRKSECRCPLCLEPHSDDRLCLPCNAILKEMTGATGPAALDSLKFYL